MAQTIISRTISQLFGGVSQQPPQLRSDSQCEVMDNCWPDPAVGLSKRPPSKLIKKLNTSTDANRAIHFINRDNTERYTVIADGSTLKVYDLADGTEKAVTIADGSAYLASAAPKDDFKFLTVADTTFVVNRGIVPAMDSTLSGIGESTRWVKVKILSLPSEYVDCTAAKFVVKVNGVSYTSTVLTSIANLLANIVSTINTALTGSGYSVTGDGVDTMTITGPDGVNFDVDAYAVDSNSVCRTSVNYSRVKVTSGGSLNGNVGFVYIKAAVARQKYVIDLDGTEYTFTVATDSSNALTTSVATGLAALIPGATYTVDVLGSALRIARNDGGTFSFKAYDSYGDTGLIYFTDSVPSQADLPPNFWADYVISVRGDASADSPRLYVTFKVDRWEETMAPGLKTTFAPSTMPHKLVRQSDGTFVFGKIDWSVRAVGDDESNQIPSFIGVAINEVFFYRERFGFLCGENVVMSKTSDYYNFWRTSVAAVTNDDPIDITVADPRVAQLYHALPFQESLLLFSDTAQFQLSGDDVLSPQTVRLDATTKFNTDVAVRPVAAGRTVFFPVARGEWTSVREYFLMPDATQSDAVDITAHVPSYVPGNLRTLAASSLIDAVFVLSEDEPSNLYFNKFLWNGDQKVQSAWGRLVFPTEETILGIEVIDTRLYIVFTRSGGTFLSYIDFQPHLTEVGMAFQVYLDCTNMLTGVYDAGTGKTTWSCPHAYTGTIAVVLGTAFGSLAGLRVNTSPAGSNSVEAVGDFSAGPCFTGLPYTMTYRFSELYVKDSDKAAVTNGRLMLRNMRVEFDDTAYFRGEVTPYLRDKATYTFNGAYLGGASAILGQVFLSSDEFKFPVISENRGCQIDLVNDSHLPSTFQTVSWDALFAPRSRRV